MAKTDFLTADMTRRQFMKISGKSLAGLTLSASMLSLFGCSQKQVDSGAVATWALPQGLLVVNADLCTGCQRCQRRPDRGGRPFRRDHHLDRRHQHRQQLVVLCN